MTSAPAAPRYWRVVFDLAGAIDRVEEITGPTETDWLIVEASDEQAAQRKAYNAYARRKKKVAIARLRAEGRCRCGRAQDRTHPDGSPMLTCAVCGERQEVWRQRHAERRAAGTIGAPIAQEPRVESHRERQRDRKAELRLELLIEVRQQWMVSPNVGRFGSWLQREIDALTGAQNGAQREALPRGDRRAAVSGARRATPSMGEQP